jgi:putative addiction module component (TIGR02574 family)
VRTLTKQEISDLPIAERIRLISELWDSIPPENLPVPDSHRQALDESLREHAENPNDGRAWSEVRDDLFPKK